MENILKKDLNKYNLKTFGIEEFKESILKKKIFTEHIYLKFLPKEFHEFLELYKIYPDKFIKIYEYEQYMAQYYNNMLLSENHVIRFILFHRDTYVGIQCTKIQLIYLPQTNNYCIFKNFKLDDHIGDVKKLTFIQALDEFFKN